jgi:putative heme-binding domain-containing protein
MKIRKSFPLLSAILLSANWLPSATVPEGFRVTRFAGYPHVTYPTAVAAAPTGEVYVSIDRNSSLGADPGRGKIVRYVDTNSDGQADEFTDFVPNIDSPRGGCFVDGTLYVINPPFLTAFRDTTGDGMADEKQILIKGLGFDLAFRGADHTSNGARMGIDGWLYLAIGDYGFFNAEGTDGQSIHLHGGGIVRVRPDGTEIEHYAKYLRNIYDVAVSPELDVFARDNTNDGKGWNTRLHHSVALADHGYPRLYKNFPNEHIQPLADYGGGSGTGSYWLDEPGFPAAFNNRLYTCDFTTRKVYGHSLEQQESTFKAGQDIFYDIQAIDLDCDGSSRIFVCDWTGGAYRFDKEEVGSISQITYPGLTANTFPNLPEAPLSDLLEHLASLSAVTRINSQHELLKREETLVLSRGLNRLIRNTSAPLAGRIAAIFTLKQKFAAAANATLLKAAKDATIREWCLRAATDRRSQLENVTTDLYLTGLKDPNSRVQLQAAIGLSRLGNSSIAGKILALAEDPDAGFSTEKDLVKKYSANQIIPHVAIHAVVELNAAKECLAALSDRALRPAALRALQLMHTDESARGLVTALNTASVSEIDYRLAVLKALFRLYHQDRPWDGKKWWTTRPDDRGPYFEPIEWARTKDIKAAIEKSFNELDESYHAELLYEMRRNRIDPMMLALNVQVDEVLAVLDSPSPSSTVIPLLEEAASSATRDLHTRVAAFHTLGRIPGKEAFNAQLAVMAVWNRTDPASASYQSVTREFIFSPTHVNRPKILRDILRKPKGYGGRITLMAALNLVNSPLGSDYLKNLLNPLIDRRKGSLDFIASVGELLLSRYLPDVQAAVSSENPATAEAAQSIAARLEKLTKLTAEQKQTVAVLGVEKAAALVLKTSGDKALGNQIFARQSCLACHTLSQAGEQKGPYLGDAGSKWQRDYLIHSILQPSAVVAQGFQTQWFETKDDFSYDGFVTAEADGVIEIRNAAGQVLSLKESDVVERGTRTTSMMPEGLVDNLTVFELASLLDYLQSLH